MAYGLPPWTGSRIDEIAVERRIPLLGGNGDCRCAEAGAIRWHSSGTCIDRGGNLGRSLRVSRLNSFPAACLVLVSLGHPSQILWITNFVQRGHALASTCLPQQCSSTSPTLRQGPIARSPPSYDDLGVYVCMPTDPSVRGARKTRFAEVCNVARRSHQLEGRVRHHPQGDGSPAHGGWVETAEEC